MAERRSNDLRGGPGGEEGNMSVREAGRKGGRTTRQRYGAEFFQEIGAKGGKAVSERYSNEHFREIGRKGGRRVAELIARAKRLDSAHQERE
jgi:general stress protein YciG